MDREKMERGAAERQLADRVKELNELRTKFDAYSAETNVRLATQFDTSRQNRPMHWRRQLWGTGARAPLDLQQFIFSLHHWAYKSIKQIIPLGHSCVVMRQSSQGSLGANCTRTIILILLTDDVVVLIA